MGPIGLGEFLLIILIVAVILGPEKMPDLARQAGKMVRSVRKELKKFDDSIQGEVETIVDKDDVNTLREEIDGLKEELKIVKSVNKDLMKKK